MQQPPTQQPRSQAESGAADELRSDAQQLGSSAANRLHSEVDARKGQAADQAKSVSSAMQKAAGELDQSSPEWIKSAFRQGAAQIQRFADTLEHKDSRQLMGEARQFARDNPATFLAACAAAGFAAARVLKAGGEQQSSQDTGGQQPWQQRDRSQDGNRAMFRSSETGSATHADTTGELA